MVRIAQTELLNEASKEEKGYNWAEAAKLYEQIAKFYLDENLIEKAAKFYDKFGDICFRAFSASKTKNDFLNWKEQAVKAFNKAESLFIQINDKLLGMECKAKALYTKGYAPSSIEKGKAVLKESINLCFELNEIYARRNEKENIVKLSILIL